MSYHTFKDDYGNEHGSFEVFYRTAAAIAQDDWRDGDGDLMGEGWYWWACFPGCMPDGDACGPFATEREAYDDAQEGA